MKKNLLLLLLLLASCDKNNLTPPMDNGSPIKSSIKIDSLKDQSISMNSQFGPFIIILKDVKSPLDSITLSVKSSNWLLVDTNSIVINKIKDSITLTLFPILGRFGESQISLLVRDKENIDSTRFKLTVIASNNNKSYPTILNKLTASELIVKQNEFKQLLGTNYTATIDSFGLLGHLTGLLQRGQSSINSTELAVSIAKNAMIAFRNFTNIADTSILIVQEATKNNSGPAQIFTDWTISFKNQLFKNIEVWDTRILILIKDGLTSMDWRHYRDVFIPNDDLINKDRIKKKLVGTVINYDCWTTRKFTITDASIKSDSLSLCVYPLTKSNSIELRVTWKVPIYSSSTYPSWYYFIDVLTGEIIGLKQLFIC